MAERAATLEVKRAAPPRASNRVVPLPDPAAKSGMLTGRALTSPEQVTHASRNVSPQELDDILKRGYFLNPEGGTKHTQQQNISPDSKWWSAADENGVFGRQWAKGAHTVRVPIGKMVPEEAVSADFAEIFDPVANAWKPLRKARGGFAVQRRRK